MKSADIRETFLKFFENYHHQRVKSSSLIPAADPTLLFTNAGMVQFKDAFLGLSDPGYRRAATSQKCMRAGGKHNDLENVGFTPRHHTFFEMLGNFSFGDYFKKDAIDYAWELLTRHFKLPTDKLRVTVFETDDEAYDLWVARGVRKDWIYRLGEKDNFWAMGDTGPCGPCSEIYFDWGPEYGCKKPDCNPGCGCGLRFLEIWNLVFMQFNRDASGKLTPLPKPSVDTGAGLERVAGVLQGKYNNYDTDVFQPIIEAIAKRVGKSYGKDESETASMRVIADHMRAGTFLLADGVTPSNEGRGYVLRRILRRAIRHGKKLGQEKPFLFDLVDSVAISLGDVYPELRKNQKVIEVMMKEEEDRFHETLHRGIGLLEETIAKTKQAKSNTLSGEVAFKLYDSFGFPVDLVEVIAREHKLDVDLKVFEQLMEKQRSQSVWKQAGQAGFQEALAKSLEGRNAGEFLGYDTLQNSEPIAVLFSGEGTPVKELKAGQAGFAVFARTPFYAESGGQVGDTGTISTKGGKAKVGGVFKSNKVIVHGITVESGAIKESDRAELEVDARWRKLTAINHTATHLLHAKLREVLGERVKQAGSLVEPGRLRFDFTFPRPLTEEEKLKIEAMINADVAEGHSVDVKEMGYDQAMKSGALAFFDEKYGDKVRVVRVGKENAPVSVELCGGTHLKNIGDIGFFKILAESSVASGVRRIEAITSETAIAHMNGRDILLKEIEQRLSAKDDQVLQKLEQLRSAVKELSKENERLQLKVAQSGGSAGKSEGGGGALWDQKKEIAGLNVVMAQVPSAKPNILRSLVDQVRDKLKEKTVVALASESDGKVFLCVGLTKDLVGKWDATKIIPPMAEHVGGSGGGRPDFAQAGGTNAGGVQQAFDTLASYVMKNAN